MDSAPIREAILVPGTGDPLRPVAGEPLLVRTILALERGGIERCTLVGALRPPADDRIRCAVAAAPTLTPAADDRLRLVVPVGTVIDSTLVRDLQSRARPDEVVDVESDGARVRIAPGRLLTAGEGRPVRPRAGTLRQAGAPGIEADLLRALDNPRDGYLDRVLHRRLSRPLTRLLLATPVSPNVVTIVGILLGTAGGLLLGVPGPSIIAALLLLEASAVLDCSDGELARVRFAESRLGHWLDVAGDTVVHVAVLAGISIRITHTGVAPARAVLVALLLGVLAAFAVITWSEETAERRARVGGWENRVLDGVLSPLTTRDWHVFPIAFALAGRLDVLVPAAAIGAQVFWVAGVALLWRTLARSPRA
jgi:phosphatidylglycerophosphate synthase